MKLTIELNDETLKNAIGQQLERVVAAEVREQINSVVDAILTQKLARFTDEVMAHRVEMAARTMIEQALANNDWSRTAALKAAVDRAALKYIEERMK